MIEFDMARELLKLAEEDVAVFEILLKSDYCPPRICGFHAQQAVEKALKVWLILLDVDYPLTHSIYTLLSLISDNGADCVRYKPLEALSPYAVQFRYGESSIAGQVDITTLVPEIRDLIAQVRGLL